MPAMTSTESAANQDYTRLYITPFNPSLLDILLGPSGKSQARSTSFHKQQTFPERGFGYIELPAMEAQKLKRKLNGSTLKGAKVRVEEAKAEKKRKLEDGDEEDVDEGKKVRKRERRERREREEGVLPGYELEEGRMIKRGWTEDGTKVKKPKKEKSNGSRTSGKSEVGFESKKLRFKTAASPVANAAEGKDHGATKPKKDKDSKKHKDKQVVEEFSKRTKLSNIQQTDPDSMHGTTYEDGRGWVDEHGTVVEPEHASTKRRRGREPSLNREPISAIESHEVANDLVVPVADAHNDGSDRDDIQSEIVDDDQDEDISSDDEKSAEEDEDSEKEEAKADPAPPASNSAPLAEKEIHPLEALFKRPTTSASEIAKPRPKPINTSFSFFGSSGGDDHDDLDAGREVHDSALPPQTPRTKRDLEWRGLRSAAPTPDTAVTSKRFSFSIGVAGEEDGEDQREEDADADADADENHPTALQQPNGSAEEVQPATTTVGDHGEESAFRKWFYENRGDLNRGWKKRRRDERKLKRQRENRRLGRKVA